MKIWHFSDTHTFHNLLSPPDGIDIAIFSGDCSNPRDPFINMHEVVDFMEWFAELDVKHKVFVAGNHDTSIEKKLIHHWDFNDRGIHYLENFSKEVAGLKIFGSPYTPTFGVGWAFNKDRVKLERLWRELIEPDVDIVVTHGPPKGVLDLSYNQNRDLEQCGDRSLMNRIVEVNPKLSLFGHIHNHKDLMNQGTARLNGVDTLFSNGSVVKDGQFGHLSSNGNVIEL